MNILKRLIGKKVELSPNQLIKKFVDDSEHRHVQMEFYNSRKLILQLESLKHVPIWLKWCKMDESKYKDGYVCNFYLKMKNINSNKIYKNYIDAKSSLNMVEHVDVNYKIVNFVYFFEKDSTPLEIGDYSKKVIEKVYGLSNPEERIKINLRYLKLVRR